MPSRRDVVGEAVTIKCDPNVASDAKREDDDEKSRSLLV
jgi:hypothetical protein